MSTHGVPGQRPAAAGIAANNPLPPAVYGELDDTLLRVKSQWKSAILADARLTPGSDGKPSAVFSRTESASLSLRQISAELGSVLIDTLGLAATIDWYAREFQNCTGIDYDLSIDDAADAGLAEAHATAIFRICHEALSNIARHARAGKAAIKLSITAHALAMVVSDNGIGISEKQAFVAGSGGLAEIHEYTHSKGGLCRIVGTPNRGTILSISLPLVAASSAASGVSV